MTAVLSAVAVAPAGSSHLARSRRVAELPLSVQAADYESLLEAGYTAVDIRPQHVRARDGVLSGALAIDPLDVVERLTPGAEGALRVADADARWVLISDDGHDAEWVAWHLQANAVPGAVFVVGGYASMTAARIRGRISDDELATISAHAVG